MGAKKFQIRAEIINRVKSDFKSGQGLQIGAEQLYYANPVQMSKFLDKDTKIGCHTCSNLPMSNLKSAQILLLCSFLFVLLILSMLQHLALVSALLTLWYLKSAKYKKSCLFFGFYIFTHGSMARPLGTLSSSGIHREKSPFWENASMRVILEVHFLLAIHIFLNGWNSGISGNGLTECSD